MGIVWTIVGIAVPLLIGVGITLMAMPDATQNEFFAARVCFLLSALILGGWTLWWEFKIQLPLYSRILVGCVVGSLLFVLFPLSMRWLNIRQSGEPTQPASIRLKYSSRQAVQFSSQPGDYNETINLDNTAILALGDPSDSESVTMSLQSEAPRTITKPQFGEKYPAGNDTLLEFPADGRGKFEITDLTISAFSGQFHFDTSADRV